MLIHSWFTVWIIRLWSLIYIESIDLWIWLCWYLVFENFLFLVKGTAGLLLHLRFSSCFPPPSIHQLDFLTLSSESRLPPHTCSPASRSLLCPQNMFLPSSVVFSPRCHIILVPDVFACKLYFFHQFNKSTELFLLVWFGSALVPSLFSSDTESQDVISNASHGASKQAQWDVFSGIKPSITHQQVKRTHQHHVSKAHQCTDTTCTAPQKCADLVLNFLSTLLIKYADFPA